MARAIGIALAAILVAVPGCSQSPADVDPPLADADGGTAWWANWTYGRPGPVALVVDGWSDGPAECVVAWDVSGPADGDLFFAMGFRQPTGRQDQGLQEWGFGHGAPGAHASVGGEPVQVLPPSGILVWTSAGQQTLSLAAGESFTFVAALHSLAAGSMSATCTDGDVRLFAGHEMHALLPAGGEASASAQAASAGTGSFQATTTGHVVVIAQTIPTSDTPAGFVDIDIGTPQNATTVRFEGSEQQAIGVRSGPGDVAVSWSGASQGALLLLDVLLVEPVSSWEDA